MSHDLTPERIDEEAQRIYEKLGFIRIHAENAQRSMQIGDRVGAQWAMRSLAANTRDAVDRWNNLRRQVRETRQRHLEMEAPDHAASTP